MNTRDKQRLVATIRKVVNCQHRYASEYQFIVSGDVLPGGGKRQLMILGRRCPDCGAIESKHVPWVQPHEVRDLGRLLEELELDDLLGEDGDEPGIAHAPAEMRG